jgi:peptidyl-tRNA hydrolase, PTH1 family
VPPRVASPPRPRARAPTSPEQEPLTGSTITGGAGTAGAPGSAVPETKVSEGPFLIVGLGNPGPGYAGNRHNVGAMVLDELAARSGVKLSPGKGARARALAGEGRLAGRRVVLARPLTYMNESGGPVRGLLDYHHLPVEDLVVIHDELDIPFASVRLKRGGGEGGHNGLRSITRSTGTKDYLRVRVGIGRPPGRQEAADFVLKDFSAVERKELDLLVAEAADAVEALVARGLEAAQNEVHART